MHMIPKFFHLQLLLLICSSKLDKKCGGIGLDSSFAVSSVSKCTNDNSCPTWNFCNSLGSCQCGENHHDIIHCNDKSKISAVLDCNCVTYDEATGFAFAGACFYNCMNNAINADRVYHILPKKAFDLNGSQSACSWFNRKGLLCGECEEGFSPFVILTTSVAQSVQMVTRIGGSLLQLFLFLSQSFIRS